MPINVCGAGDAGQTLPVRTVALPQALEYNSVCPLSRASQEKREAGGPMSMWLLPFIAQGVEMIRGRQYEVFETE